MIESKTDDLFHVGANLHINREHQHCALMTRRLQVYKRRSTDNTVILTDHKEIREYAEVNTEMKKAVYPALKYPHARVSQRPRTATDSIISHNKQLKLRNYRVCTGTQLVLIFTISAASPTSTPTVYRTDLI